MDGNIVGAIITLIILVAGLYWVRRIEKSTPKITDAHKRIAKQGLKVFASALAGQKPDPKNIGSAVWLDEVYREADQLKRVRDVLGPNADAQLLKIRTADVEQNFDKYSKEIEHTNKELTHLGLPDYFEEAKFYAIDIYKRTPTEAEELINLWIANKKAIWEMTVKKAYGNI